MRKDPDIKKELLTGIEPVTPSLPRKCSTSEPQQLFCYRTILYQRKDSLSNKNWILSTKYGKILNKSSIDERVVRRRVLHESKSLYEGFYKG